MTCKHTTKIKGHTLNVGGDEAELPFRYVPYNPKLAGIAPDRWFWFCSWCSLAAAAE